MRACWLKWVGRDWSISADYIWLNYSDANIGDVRARLDSHAPRAAVWSIAAFPGVRFNGHGIDLGSSLFGDHAPRIIEAITLAQALAVVGRALHGD